MGAGHGRERTANMYCMSMTLEVSKLSGWLNADAPCRESNMLRMVVTLDVSKLSGWLNADAPCRGSKEGHAVRGEVYGSGGSRRWTTTAHAACRGGRGCKLWGQGTGS